MSDPVRHRRRVGTVRPSHLMFTGGVGALVDLPNFSVLVGGLDDWRYDHPYESLTEPRLLAAVQAQLGRPGFPERAVTELRPAPWQPEAIGAGGDVALRTGVPVTPFPQWFRCSACDELGPYDPGVWGFVNDRARRPDLAQFFHANCPSRRRQPLAVPARFLLACVAGHLDDFPYRPWVHHGADCPKATHPGLRMHDYGGNLGANVRIRCVPCGASRNIADALGQRGQATLPACRGRHPHLHTFNPCGERPMVLVAGASNTWFPRTLTALAVPKPSTGRLDDEVDRQWANLAGVTSPEMLAILRGMPALAGTLAALREWTDADVLAAIDRHRQAAEEEPADGSADLLGPEWTVFTASALPEPSVDFTARRAADAPSDIAGGVLADVVQIERLREVRALTGFTRLDAPDPEDPDLVTVAPLGRGTPSWVPASEVRGEGIFLRIDESQLASWEQTVETSSELGAFRDAYVRFRTNRRSDRVRGEFDPMRGWPGARYLALHTLSHLLIRTIALDCGYSSASLSERIYSRPPGDDGQEPRAGILIYTAVPDAEGTLGGLVSLAEPERLRGLVRRALGDARRCSSDPLCRERLPQHPADFLHGAACHVCLFVSETTCERGNRFLDRRFVIPLDDPKLALVPEW